MIRTYMYYILSWLHGTVLQFSLLQKIYIFGLTSQKNIQLEISRGYDRPNGRTDL